MFRLKRFLAAGILMLSFLAGHQLGLKAQCQACNKNPGPAGTFNYFEVILGVCPCNSEIDCIFYECDCSGFVFGHSQCGTNVYPDCIGC